MNPQLIIAALIAACGFASGWTLQSWRYGAKETARAQQELVDQRMAAATAVRRIDNVVEAQNAAVVREQRLRADVAGSHAALLGLSDATASALRSSNATLATCTVGATALGELFVAAADAGGELAEKADRHAGDVQTCRDAWPK